jgi:chromosome segregation ATPase
MRQYFTNLMTALRGHNPFELELQRVRDDYNRVVEQVAQLEKVFGSVKKQTEKAICDVNSYQRLVENLRKRLSEKDALIDSMKEDYQQRINNYKTEIAELQNRAN